MSKKRTRSPGSPGSDPPPEPKRNKPSGDNSIDRSSTSRQTGDNISRKRYNPGGKKATQAGGRIRKRRKMSKRKRRKQRKRRNRRSRRK